MADIFVIPQWIEVPGGSTTVYVSGASVYKNNPGGGTAELCYKDLVEAVFKSHSGDTINACYTPSTYVSFPLEEITGEYKPADDENYSHTGSRKNLVVRANSIYVGSSSNQAQYFYSRNAMVSGAITMDFRIRTQFLIENYESSFTVQNGAVFIVRKVLPSQSKNLPAITNRGTFTVSGATACVVGNLFMNTIYQYGGTTPPWTSGKMPSSLHPDSKTTVTVLPSAFPVPRSASAS